MAAEKMIAAFEKLPIQEQNDFLAACTEIYQKNSYAREAEEIKSNLFFINKYYKREIDTYILDQRVTKYYKVISPFASNTYRVSMLSFPSVPKMSLLTSFSLASGLNKLDGKIDLDSFKVEDVWVRTTRNPDNTNASLFSHFKEISKEEWEEAFDNHCKVLKDLRHKYENEEVFLKQK